MNHRLLIVLINLLISDNSGYSQEPRKTSWLKKPVRFEFVEYSPAEILLSDNEYKLYLLIMDYRKSNNKPEIPLSRALSFVARTHAGDLDNDYISNRSCNLNSWSKNEKWTPCCYTSDHKKADCMWDKPRELTSYTGDGYELVYWKPSDLTPEGALDKWKNNPLNNPVILNTEEWEEVTWEAVGVGIYGGFATVWFGKVTDTDGKPGIPAGGIQ